MARNPDKAPPGGWLGPPPTEGLKPLGIAKKARKGEWLFEPVRQTAEDKELRKEWERRKDKADRSGKWRFKWPPKRKD